ncbi:MAG: F0F1 ATP synthase subunit delta [Bacilli bacterium]|nr:F0F1 ATP synthase subunit delta [Bacilli bacterium]
MKDSLDVRYAIALFTVAKEDNQIKKYQSEIKMVKLTLDENQTLLNLFKSEFLSSEKRYQVVDKVFKQNSSAVRNFLKILIKNHRLNSYQAIFNRFNSLCNEENHVLEGIVYSVDKLDENKIHELEKALKSKNKVDVELTNRIDPSLIGGIKVVINNHIYDYSIQNELMNMRSQLKI